MNQEKNTKKPSILKIIGIVIFLLILLIGASTFLGNDSEKNPVSMVNSSSEEYCPEGQISNEIGECEPINKVSEEVIPEEESGLSGTTEELDFRNNLFPYKEADESSSSLLNKELLEATENHQPYYRLLSFKQGEKLSFAVGYMEGCPDGCYLDGNICPKECHDPDNWREVKSFTPAEYIEELGGGETRNNGTFSGGMYYGQFYNFTVTGCAINPSPLKLARCNPYGNLEKTKGYRIWIEDDDLVIVLE